MVSRITSISDSSIDREIVRRRGFSEFVRIAWSHIEPAPLIWGWHIDEVCKHLEAVTRGEIRKLIINLPPGFSKSLICSVLWPAWTWTIDPERKFICASYEATLAQRDAKKERDLIDTQWFKGRWGSEVMIPRTNERSVRVFKNSQGGFRFSTGVGAGFTGWHAHVHLADDPHAVKDCIGSEAHIKKKMESAGAWWGPTMASRIADPNRIARVIIMQRLHENDLTGQMLREGGYTHLCLPMHFTTKSASKTISLPSLADHRTTEGELLCPARYSEDAVKERARALGPTAAAAQDEQQPAPPGGLIFERAWLGQFWQKIPAGATWIASWDLSFKKTDDSSYVVGQIWARFAGSYYLVDQFRERLGFADTCTAITTFAAKHPKAVTKLVEAKANGPAVVEALKKRLSGLTEVEPDGGKEARAQAVSPLFAAGNIWLPNPETAPWVHEYIEELATFPKAAHDDQVDSTSQALNYLYSKATRLKEAMANAREQGWIS